MKFALFFVIGVHYGQRLLTSLLDNPARSLLILLCATGVIHIANVVVSSALGWPPFKAAERLTACGAVVAGALIVSDGIGMKPLAWLGRHTMPIFLAHPLVLRMIAPIGINSYIDPVLLTVLAIAACLAIHRTARLVGMNWLYTKPSLIASSGGSIMKGVWQSRAMMATFNRSKPPARDLVRSSSLEES